MNSELVKVEICFYFILGKIENKVWLYYLVFIIIIYGGFFE